MTAGFNETSKFPLLDERGVTLIELLVVILFIGVLVTIVLPRFNHMRETSYDAAAQADLRNALAAQEAYYADNQIYADDVGNLDFEQSIAVTTTITAGDAANYEMNSQHDSSDNDYCIDSDVGEIQPCP